MIDSPRVHRRRNGPASSTLVAFVLAGGLLSAVACAAGPLDGLDRDVLHALATTATPGAAVAIVKDGKPIFVEGFGLRRAGSPDRVDVHTLFAIGSLTKAFTAADIALLVDAGKVDLDAPIRQYVPAFALQDAYRGEHASVRDLLAHRTGLGDTNWLTVNTTLTPEAIIERLAYVTSDAGFREKYLYQNTMYMVLGQAIRNVSGLDWATFTQQRVLAPLGMLETLTHTPGGSPDAATPHLVTAGVARVIAPLDITSVAPAGAMYSSASDLARWLAFQVAEGKDGGLVSARLLGEMHSAQLARQPDPYLYPDANFLAYGLAWIPWDYHGLRVVSHDGAIDGMTAKICLVPSLGLGIVVVSNAEYSPVPNVIVYDVLDRMMPGTDGRPSRDWEAHFVPLVAMLLQGRAADETELQGLIAHGKVLAHAPAGTYRSPLFGAVTVSPAPPRDRIELLGRSWPLLPLTDGRFAVDVGAVGLEHADFRLRFAGSGADAALTIAVGGHEYALRRDP